MQSGGSLETVSPQGRGVGADVLTMQMPSKSAPHSQEGSSGQDGGPPMQLVGIELYPIIAELQKLRRFKKSESTIMSLASSLPQDVQKRAVAYEQYNTVLTLLVNQPWVGQTLVFLSPLHGDDQGAYMNCLSRNGDGSIKFGRLRLFQPLLDEYCLVLGVFGEAKPIAQIPVRYPGATR